MVFNPTIITYSPALNPLLLTMNPLIKHGKKKNIINH